MVSLQATKMYPLTVDDAYLHGYGLRKWITYVVKLKANLQMRIDKLWKQVNACEIKVDFLGYGNSLQKTGPMESDYVLLRAEILATFFSMESKHFTDIDVQNDVIHPETLSYRMKIQML